MIQGLRIINDYITEEQENSLLEKIKLSGIVMPTSERNTIRRYGSRVPYNSRVRSNDIPEYLQSLCQRLVLEKLFEEMPDSVTINEYRKDQGIAYHIDSQKSGPVIVVLSLLSKATMGMKNGDGTEKTFNIPRRALVVMEKDARELWQHCILPVEENRISVVFRKGTL